MVTQTDPHHLTCVSTSTGPASETDADLVWRSREILDWLLGHTHPKRYIDDVFVELCEKLQGTGIPLSRASMNFRTHHPERLAARVVWKAGTSQATISTLARDVAPNTRFTSEPFKEIYSGATEVRRNLETLRPTDRHHADFSELLHCGLTDYVAWPLNHTLGETHAVSFSTAQIGGFSEADVQSLKEIVPALSLTTEVRLKNIRIRSILETYVGPHASEEILAGATTRGSGVTVGAAILISDLRDFTAISDRLPRDLVINILNGYFDAISQPIENHGGEILKFMGDGLLAIFPLTNPNACADLLLAVKEAQVAMHDLNTRTKTTGRPSLRYGMGIHVGDVMYGNIGSRKRLDFTAIGPAVNAASRLETLTKRVKRSVLLSGEFVGLAQCHADLDHLGYFPLRGVHNPVEVFALR